jgi:hypothetical protein
MSDEITNPFGIPIASYNRLKNHSQESSLSVSITAKAIGNIQLFPSTAIAAARMPFHFPFKWHASRAI